MFKMYKWVHSRTTVKTWAWIHAFVALGLGWGHAIALYPPTTFTGVVDLNLVLRMGVITAIGSIVAIVGLLMASSAALRNQHRGLWIGLVGTVLMAGGPLQYLSIQIGFLVSGEFALRYALVWFSYAMYAFVLVRFAVLIPAIINSSEKANVEERRKS